MRLLSLALCASLTLATPTYAQLIAPPAPPSDATAGTPSPSITPSPSAAFQSGRPAAFLRASQGDEDVSIKTGLRLLGRDATITAKAALSEKGSTELINIGGLNAGTTIALGWRGTLMHDMATDDEIVRWCVGLDAQSRNNIDCSKPDTYGTGTFASPVAASFPADRFYLWELTGELGHTEMKFLHSESFEPGSEDRYAGSVGLNVGTIHRGLLLGAGGRFEGSWDEGDEVEICLPIGSGSATQCRTGPLGAPKYEREVVLSLQARRFIGPRFGFHAQADYHPTQGQWEMQVPLYFAPDAGGALIGGITPGYDFKGEEFSLILFVGTALKLAVR